MTQLYVCSPRDLLLQNCFDAGSRAPLFSAVVNVQPQFGREAKFKTSGWRLDLVGALIMPGCNEVRCAPGAIFLFIEEGVCSFSPMRMTSALGGIRRNDWYNLLLRCSPPLSNILSRCWSKSGLRRRVKCSGIERRTQLTSKHSRN